MKKFYTLFVAVMLAMVGLPVNSWAQNPPTAPDGYDLVEDPTTLQAGDVIILRQASGNNYMLIDNTRTTDASAATAFVLEDAGTAGDFCLKAQGTDNYLKAVAAGNPLSATADVSEIGVFNLVHPTTSGTAETKIDFSNFLSTEEGKNYVVRLVTTSTANGARIWYNSNGWSFGTGPGHWTAFFAFKQQVVNPDDPINYTVKVSGTSDATAGVVYDGATYNDGATITVEEALTADELTAVVVEGYQASVAISGTRITVTYTDEKFIVNLTDLYVNNLTVEATTDPIVEGQWYLLTQVRRQGSSANDAESPAYDAGSGSTIMRAGVSVTPSSVLTANTPASDISKYLLRFIPSGVGNGYYIQFATGNLWNGVQTTESVASAGLYLLYNATHTAANYTGWRINATSDGSTYGSIVDNNGAGYGIAFWSTGYATTGTNNVWKLYPVELGAMLSEVNFDVEITDGSNTKVYEGMSITEGTTLNAADFLGISSEYIVSTSHTVSTADEGQTITLEVSSSDALPFNTDASYAWQSAVGNGPSYVHVDETLAAVNAQDYTIDFTKPVSAENVWKFDGDVVNGFAINNVYSGQYLGGRTAAGGAMSMESDPSMFMPIYNTDTNFKWYNNENDYWIDRSSGAPYAHTSGNLNALTQLWLVTVQLSDPAAGLVVGGDTIDDLTSIYISDAAEITLASEEYAISGFNGKTTLAEALAELNPTSDMLVINVTQELSNVTINVVDNGNSVKTVTVENVAAGRTIDVAEVIGDVPFVTGYEPATITATADDQTVDVTYTTSLPVELAADPASDDAAIYFITLRKYYAQGSDASSSSNFDDTDDYLWSFGGDVFRGVTVYNKAYGYMTVENADNSVATFSETPTLFVIKPNNKQANGFNLNLPETDIYINSRDNKVSTWNQAAGNNDEGSCLVAIPEADGIETLIDNLENLFNVTDVVGALPSSEVSLLREGYETLKTERTKENYRTFKAQIDEKIIQLTPDAYYIVQSAYPGYYTNQGVYKAWYYSASSSKVKWRDLDAWPEYQVFQVVDNGSGGNVFFNPMSEVYLSNTDGSVTTDITAAKTFTLSSLGNGQYNIFLEGVSSPIHTAGHSNGAGQNGDLTNWNGGANSASSWYIVPQDIETFTLISPEGVADDAQVVQAFANATDAQLPVSIGVFTISEETGVGAHLDTIASGKIAAGQGYIVSGTKGKIVPLLPVSGTVEVPAGNLLVAGDGSVVNGGYMLAYRKGESDAKFWTINALTIPENDSYLPEGTPTRGLESIFGGLGEDVTGINGVNAGSGSNAAIYDLQGRRVSNAQKGVYIINGKKVMK